MEKIFNPNYSDDINRDLYLASFYDRVNPRQGPLQGNIFKDKPWTIQYIKNIPNIDFDVNVSLFENYCRACKDSLDKQILFFENKTYTNGELINMAVNLAKGLQKFTTRAKISVFVNNSIEEPAILLATSLCGGVVQFVDITKSPDDMKKSVEEFGPDLMLMDEQITPLIPFLNQENVPVIVGNTNNEYENEKMISFNKMIEQGKNNELKPIEKFNPKDPFLIITSSGTTGRPKPITHSIYAVNEAILKVLFTDYPLDKNNVMMKIIPAHIGLGIITTLSTSLISGTKLAFIAGNGPADSIDKTITFIKEYPMFRKNNGIDEKSKLLMFAAPMFCKALETAIDASYITDLSYMDCILVAGAKISEDELKRLATKYEQLGFYGPICNGYGNNENGGAVTLNSNSYNTNGSGGFPTIGTDVIIVDENNNPVINKEGRIFVLSGSQFLYYLDMEEETQKTKVDLFGNGELWVAMNDIGYMNNFGFIFITGRSTRVIERFDCKISIDNIEDKMKKHPAINECAVLGINNKTKSGETLYSFITLRNPEYDHAQLMDEIEKNPNWLSQLEKPDITIILEKMPYMNNGKINYIKLGELAQEHHNKICKSEKCKKKVQDKKVQS